MTALVELYPIDPGTGARVPLRICAAQQPEATGAGDFVWWPAITVQPILSMTLFDGAFSSAVSVAQATMEVRLDVLRNSGQFPRVERYDWSGATAVISRLVDGLPVFVAAMRVERFASEQDRLSLSLAMDEEPLEAKVLFNEYAGTTGAEGTADLKGKPKPWAFGRCINVEPVFIDKIDNVYQVSAYGPVQAIPAVYERGASFGASVGDFASYAALVAADIPEGRWGTCLAQGMFRLGAPPAGVITCDVDGDNAGGFLRRTGAIIQEIAGRLGVPLSVNAASLSALDAAVPRDVNVYLTQQTTLLDLARRMAAPCNAVAGLALDGRLIMPRIAFGTEQLTLDAQGREMPPVLGMARKNTSPPFDEIKMGAARSWRVHSFDEVAFYDDLIDRGAYDAATVYREGNIVSSPDQSRWLYINPTPTAGNAPPTWPTSSNAFWSNLAPPLNPNAVGVENGATRNEDGQNLLKNPISLSGATYVNGAAPTTVNGLPAAQLVNGTFAAVVFEDYVPVRGGESLYFSYIGWSDVANPDSIRAGYNWVDAFGNVTANDLPESFLLGTEAVGVGNSKIRGQFGAVPAEAVAVQMFVVRPTWGGSGSFFVWRPLVSRSQPGATVGAPAGTDVGGTEAAALAAQAIGAYRPRHNLLFNGRFALGLNGWENVAGAWRFVRDNRGQFVEQPLNTGGTFALRSNRPIFAGPGSQMVISLQAFADLAGPNQGIFADIEWRNGGNDTVLGFSSGLDGNDAGLFENRTPAAPSYRSQPVTAPSPTDGSGFVRGFVRIVSVGTVAYSSGGHAALGVKVEAGTTPSAISDEATDGAVLDNTFGRIRDPEAYNTQAILGPRNVTNLVPSYTVGSSNVTVNLPAHTRTIATRTGPRTLSYGAASGVVAFNTFWAAYVDDPELTGFASPAVTFTTNPNDLLFAGRYQISSGITPNSAGTGGTSGGGGGTPPHNLPPDTHVP